MPKKARKKPAENTNTFPRESGRTMNYHKIMSRISSVLPILQDQIHFFELVASGRQINDWDHFASTQFTQPVSGEDLRRAFQAGFFCGTCERCHEKNILARRPGKTRELENEEIEMKDVSDDEPSPQPKVLPQRFVRVDRRSISYQHGRQFFDEKLKEFRKMTSNGPLKQKCGFLVLCLAFLETFSRWRSS